MAKQIETSPVLPWLGTIYVSNPVAKIEIGVWAQTPGEAYDVLRDFAKYAQYPVDDMRIDKFMMTDAKHTADLIEQAKTSNDDTLD